jgi:uncharacterized protein YneF (UPF0154 family)
MTNTEFLTITVLIWISTFLTAVFIIGALTLMFRIMDKIIKDNPKNNQQVVDLALRVDKNGNVLPQRVIQPETVKDGGIINLNTPKVKPPLPTTPQEPSQINKEDK